MSFNIIQGAQSGKQPLFLITILAADGNVCYLTSKTAYGGSGLVYNGNTYLPRIQQNDIEAIQATGPQGYSGVPGFQLTIADADKYIWSNHCYPHGWAGSAITLTVLTWDLIANAYSTDSLSWSFLGSNPSHNYTAGQTVIKTISAINFARLKVPSAPVSTLCIWDFPVHYTDRVNGLSNFTSNFYQCGYSADIIGGVGNLIASGTMGGVSPTGTTFAYTGAAGTVPNTPFQATCGSEEMLVTGVSGSTWTVARGQWNTVATSHAASAPVYVPYTSCELIRSTWNGSRTSDPSVGCMARLGDVSDTSISIDGNLERDVAGNYTGHFGGNTWLAPTQYSGRSYTSGQKTLGFNSQNSSLAGSFYNFVYGTQWVNGTVLAPAGAPDSIRSEVVVCAALQRGISVSKVLVNGVQVPQNGSDLLFTWRYIQYPSSREVPNPPLAGYQAYFTGGRQGSINRDDIYNTSGTPGPDPHGSLPVIEVVVPTQLGSVQTVNILVTGPPVLCCLPIASASGSGGAITLTCPSGVLNDNPGVINGQQVYVSGSAFAAANGPATVSSQTLGPPGTITISATGSGSGTGGNIFYYAAPYLTDGSAGPACNLVWAYLDLMTWGNVDLTKIDGISWYLSARWAGTYISYTGANGSTQLHAQFKASFALNGTQQQVLAAVLTGLGNAGNLLVGANSSNGLIQCYIKQTLADQQPAAIPGSNYNTPVPSATFYFQGEWESGVSTYIIGDEVVYAGSYYYNSTGTNTTTPPPSDPTNWSAISQPTGYYAYYFNETNIELGSFKVVTTDLQETPNTFAAQFQDEYNGYVVDSITDVDPAAYAFSGNQEINVPIPIMGAPNFDQLQRVGNTKIAEALYGNPRNDPGGTLYFEFTINVQVIGLASRIGFICGLTWQALGIGTGTYPQAVRILSLKPDTDGEHWQVRCAWTNDDWYTYAYGQNPTPFQTNPLLNPPQRAPWPWQAGQLVNGLYNPLDINLSFGLAINSSVYPAQLTLSGYVPVNSQPQTLPPTVPLQASTANTGGSIPPGVYHIAISANGAAGPVSGSSLNTFITAAVPTGTSTNKITVSNIQWTSGAAPLVGVYIGSNSLNMTLLDTSFWTGSSPDSNGNPTAISITGYTGVLGLPDTVFQKFAIVQQGIAHGGVWGDTVASKTGSFVLNFPEASWTTNQWAGRVLTNYYQTGSTSQFAFSDTVASNTATALTMNHTTPSFGVGDVVVMRTLADTYSASTIGDSQFINSFSPSGLAVNGEMGYLIQIISGTGAGTSPKSVISNTSTVYTISGTFDVTPDATSVFIVLYPTQATSPTGLFSTTELTATTAYVLPVATVPAVNLTAQSMLIQVATADSNGNYAPLKYQPYREIFIPSQTLPNVPANEYLVPIVAGVATPDASKGTNLLILTADTSVAQPINYGTVAAAVTNWDLIIQQDPSGMTGGHSTIFDPSYYFTFVLASSASPANTQCHAFFRTNNTGRTSIAGAPSSDQPIPS